MRMISVQNATTGLVVAKPIYDSKLSLLIREGSQLTDRIIEKLKLADIRHLYIDDDISKGIVLEPLISEEMKFKAISFMKSLYESQIPSRYVNSNPVAITEVQIRELRALLDDIITEIYGSQDRKYYSTEFLGAEVYHFDHAVEVMILSVLIGRKLGIDRERLIKLGMGAILADLGKAKVPDAILNKRGKLTEAEFEEMKKHVIYGYNTLKDLVELSPTARQVIMLHHEKLDGSGYPNGFIDDQIPLTARIVAVCDIFSAIVADRTYNSRISVDMAIEIIRSASPIKLDAEVVHTLVQVIDVYPQGTIVELSNGDVGIVIENNQGSPTRPIVRIINDALSEVNLMSDLTLFIKKALPKLP